jgi:diguanylate cyclase (GGDEF)-like protein
VPFKSILKQPKLVLLWCLVILFGLTTACSWFWFHTRITEDSFAQKLREVQIANDAFVEHTEQVIRNVDITLSAIREYYLQTGSIRKTEQFIQHLSLSKPLAASVNLIDAAGRVTISHNAAIRGIQVQDRDYFIFHKKSQEDTLHIASVEFGRVTAEYLFRVTRRINNPDGSFGGVVLITLRPQVFSDFYRLLHKDADGLTSLIGIEDRKLRARTPETNDAAWQIQVDSILWKLLDEKPAGHYRSKSSIDNIEREFIYRRVGKLPLVLVTAFSDRDIEQSVSRQMLPITIAAFAAVFFSAMLAVILTVVFRQRDDMQKLATVDVLTGLFSRRHFMGLAEQELARAVRYKADLSVLMVDIDYFKTINDRHGHQVGDRVLRRIGEIFRTVLRDMDIVGRMGGGEFAVVLPETAVLQAFEVAERLRRTIEVTEIPLEHGLPQMVSVSIGVSSLHDPETNIDTLLGRADRALYEAKHQGRNQVCFYEISQKRDEPLESV